MWCCSLRTCLKAAISFHVWSLTSSLAWPVEPKPWSKGWSTMKKVKFNLWSSNLFMFLWIRIKVCFEINSNMSKVNEWALDWMMLFLESGFFFLLSPCGFQWVKQWQKPCMLSWDIITSTCPTSSNLFWYSENNPRCGIWIKNKVLGWMIVS